MPDELMKEINKGLDDIRKDLIEEVKAQVGEAAAQKLAGVSDTLASIQTKLNEMEAAGASVNDEKVKDLEKRLGEAESGYKDLLEDFRLYKAGTPLGQRAAEIDAMKGFFFKDQKAIADGLMVSAGERVGTKSVSSDLFSSGGQLPAEVIDGFFRTVIKNTPTFDLITNRSMVSATGTTDELVIATRALRKFVEETPPTDPSQVSIRRRTITCVDQIEPVNITRTFLEDNIERDGAERTILDQIALQIGNDLEDLAWNGDESSSVTFLALNDGWLVLAAADSNVNDVADHSGITTCANVLHAWKKQMPVKFKARNDLTFFVPYAFGENYANEFASRETAQGDQVFINGFPALKYFGHKVLPVPYLTGDSGVLTPAANLYHAYRRNVTIDSEWVPRYQRIEITITVRNDVEYASGQAIVYGTNMPAGLVA